MIYSLKCLFSVISNAITQDEDVDDEEEYEDCSDDDEAMMGRGMKNALAFLKTKTEMGRREMNIESMMEMNIFNQIKLIII